MAIQRFSEQKFVSAAHQYAAAVKHIASCWSTARSLGWLGASKDDGEVLVVRNSEHAAAPQEVQPWLNKLLFLRGAVYYFLPSVLPASFHWLLRLLGFEPNAALARKVLSDAAAQAGITTGLKSEEETNIGHLLGQLSVPSVASTSADAPARTSAASSAAAGGAGGDAGLGTIHSTTSNTASVRAPAGALAALILLWVQGFFVRDVHAGDRLLSQTLLRWKRVRNNPRCLHEHRLFLCLKFATLSLVSHRFAFAGCRLWVHRRVCRAPIRRPSSCCCPVRPNTRVCSWS